MRAIVLFFLLTGMLTACGEQDVSGKKENTSKNKTEQRLQIVTSIKPVQLIVSAITGDKAQVDQIIPDFANPHDYHFKPSDIRKINQADAIFRIDEHMEVMLNAAFEDVNRNTPIVSLADVEGVQLINNMDKDGHDHGHDNHKNTDMHIWTSPKNAIAMAKAVAVTLSKIRPQEADFYKNNLDSFIEELKTTSTHIAAQLKTVKQKPYVVFHKSWQYFATEFELKKPLVVNVQIGINSGAKTVSHIRSSIKAHNIKCIFSDSTTSTAQLKRLFDSPESQVIQLDVLAKNNDSYINWVKEFSTQVEKCLAL